MIFEQGIINDYAEFKLRSCGGTEDIINFAGAIIEVRSYNPWEFEDKFLTITSGNELITLDDNHSCPCTGFRSYLMCWHRVALRLLNNYLSYMYEQENSLEIDELAGYEFCLTRTVSASPRRK